MLATLAMIAGAILLGGGAFVLALCIFGMEAAVIVLICIGLALLDYANPAENTGISSVTVSCPGEGTISR